MRIPRVLSLVLVVVMLLSCYLQAAPFGVMAQTTAPTIVVSDAIATSGGTAKVTLGLKDNPGVISMQLQVNYDAQLLTLVKVTDAGVLGNVFHNPTYASPYVLSWVNDTAPADFMVNGTIVTLEFAVAAGLEVGTAIPVEVTYQYNNYDIYNYNVQPVQFVVDNGSVVVRHIDADGQWNTNDEQHFYTCECGENFNVGHHTGGIATCKDKAVCSVCNVAYGSLDPTNHTGKTQVKNKVAVTCDTNGYTGDTWCLDCNTKIATGYVIQALGHHVDADGKWESDATNHYHTCRCGDVFDSAAHVDANGDKLCDVCGAGTANVVYGDVDGNGILSALDAMYALQASVGKITLTDAQKTVADVTGDGAVNATDALEILKRIVGSVDKFPVE